MKSFFDICAQDQTCPCSWAEWKTLQAGKRQLWRCVYGGPCHGWQKDHHETVSVRDKSSTG